MENQINIQEVIQNNRDRYLTWLKQLCAIPSLSTESMALTDCVEFISQLAQQMQGTVRILHIPGSNPVVYLEFKGKGEETLLFYDHYDVLPPAPLEQWDVPPFEGVVKDGKFYARGAADNKGDLISRLAAIEIWKKTRGELPCNVKFLIEGEDSIGSPHLAEYVNKYKDLFISDACIWKAGNRDPKERMEIILGMKGIAFFELSLNISSVNLHSGYGAIIEGAANRLVRALATLRDSKGQVLIPGFYDDVIPPSPSVRASLEAIPFEDEVMREEFGVKSFIRERTGVGALAALILEPTCTICGIDSGYTGAGMQTVLPKEAIARVDFRLVPNQNPERIEQLLRHHLEIKGYGDINIQLKAALNPCRTEADHPFVQKVVEMSKISTGRQVLVYPNSLSSGPMYVIKDALGIPIVGLGVGYWNRRTHAPNEHIRLYDFFETIALIDTLFEQPLK
jgi:acetylornithine deacetylase/succinyl-diaminopimelate desuccinylase-like protein